MCVYIYIYIKVHCSGWQVCNKSAIQAVFILFFLFQYLSIVLVELCHPIQANVRSSFQCRRDKRAKADGKKDQKQTQKKHISEGCKEH